MKAKGARVSQLGGDLESALERRYGRMLFFFFLVQEPTKGGETGDRKTGSKRDVAFDAGLPATVLNADIANVRSYICERSDRYRR